ncbi:MAG: PHB depolymerase family esterase [Duganella sp.]
MKRSASMLRSLTRTAIRSSVRQGKAVNKLMSALFTPPAPKRKVRSKPAATPQNHPKGADPDPVTGRPRPAPASGVRVSSSASTNKAPGKWLTAHVASTTSARRLHYWLYLPETTPESALADGLPLIVMLHGCHQSATQFAQGTRMNQWAERKGYAVLYPQQAASNQTQRCWKWYDRNTQQGGGEVPALISMISQVIAEYRIDRSRIYVAGLSAGAGMAHILALNHPQLFAAVGLHSGPVFGAGHSTVGALAVMQHAAGPRASQAVDDLLVRATPFPGMPTILIQGAGDKVVRPVNQLQLMRQSLALNRLAPDTAVTVTDKAQGSSARHNPHRIHDVVDGRKLALRVVEIDALEHAWSGGDATLKFNDKTGPDASKLMLEFFARHRRI